MKTATRYGWMWLLGMALASGQGTAAPPVQDWAAVSPGGSGEFGSQFGSNLIPSSKRALAVDAAGNSYVTGSGHNGISFDYLTQKFAPDGTVLWSARYNGPGNGTDQAVALVLDGNGDVVVTGTSIGSAGAGEDYATLKYRGTDGSLVWTGLPDGAARYNSPDTSIDRAVALAVDGNGDVVVTGTSFGSATFADYATLKYSGATGEPLWSGGAIVHGAARYTGPGSNWDEVRALAVDGNGDVVVTGYSTGSTTHEDYATVKYSGVDGSIVWTDLPVGAARYTSPGFRMDHAHAVALDGNGDVVVTGRSWGSIGIDDYATLKYSGVDGSIMWTGLMDGAARYNGPGNGDDYAYAVALDGNGDVVVTGYSPGSGTGADYATLKYDGADGSILWTGLPDGAARYDAGYDEAYALAIAGDGDVVVTGASWNDTTNRDYATLKYNGADGTLRWTGLPDGAARYDGPSSGEDKAYAVALDGNGDIRVAGTRQGNVNEDYGLVRYDAATGDQQWVASEGVVTGLPERFGSYSGTDWSRRALAVDAAGNSYVTGTAWNGGNYDYLTRKFDANGALLWSASYNGPGNGLDEPQALALDGNGDVVVTGFSRGIDTGTDYATLKYDGADGSIVWTGLPDGAARYHGQPGTGNADYAYAVALASDGDVVVTGLSYGGTTNGDYATLKYNGADGSIRWTSLPDGAARYNGPDNSGDTAKVLAVDDQDDVLVAGVSSGNTGGEYATLKYNGADGSVVWTGLPDGAARYSGPGDGTHEPSGLAVDSHGDVLVTGRSQGGIDTDTDYATLKYSGADGSIVWTGLPDGAARYDGPDHGYDMATALALDDRGDVVVTGYSRSNGTGRDFATLKYDGSDGSIVWTGLPDGAARYNNTAANGNDDGNALALDVNGDVLVTGASDGSGTQRDYLTLKYAGADGTQRWEHRYDNAALVDEAYAIDIAPDGSLRIAGTATTPQGQRYAVLKLRELDNANLVALNLTGQSYTPAFASYVTAYAAAVGAEAMLELTATAQDPAASVAIAGQMAQVGASTRSVPLAFGTNAIPIVVTAVDGVTVRTYTLTAYRATIALDTSSLTQTYDGSERVAIATTQPAGLEHDLSYEGIDGTVYGPVATAPTNAGRYRVTATLTEPGYGGSASDTLVVAQAVGTVAFDALGFTYDGSPKPVTAHIVEEPASACVVPESPVGPSAGSHPVTATCDGSNYIASGNANASIAKAIGAVAFDTLSFTYDGSPRAVTAHIIQEPATACAVPESPVGPNAGSYAVKATCDGSNYTASGGDNAVISPAGQGAFGVSATPASIALGAISALSTQGGAGTGAVSFALTAGASHCALTDSTLTGIGSGTCTVTATKAADGNYDAATATVDVTVMFMADLQVAKDANRSRVQMGESVVYSIVATNAGPNDVSGATLTDTPPATLGDVEWACQPGASSAPCPVLSDAAGTGPMHVTVSLPVGTFLRYDLSATVQATTDAQIRNDATLTVPAVMTDPDPDNDVGTATIAVIPQAIFADGFEPAAATLTVPAAEHARARVD